MEEIEKYNCRREEKANTIGSWRCIVGQIYAGKEKSSGIGSRKLEKEKSGVLFWQNVIEGI